MIKNEAKVLDNEKVNILRGAIEHRASWMALMMEEAKKRGLDPEEFTRAAIMKCGIFHGDQQNDAKVSDKLCDFEKAFLNDTVKGVFEMDLVENTDDELYIEFHYCPLVAAWKKLGCSDKDIELMCDAAMDGDRGIAKANNYDYELGKTISNGYDICEVRFSRKK